MTEKQTPAVETADEAAIEAANRAEEQRIEDELGDSVEIELVELDVTRDITKTRTSVYRHEVEIMMLIHGEENVQEVGSKTVRVAGLDPDSEIDRLNRKFGKNGEAAVQRVYGGQGKNIADALGLDYKRQQGRNRGREQAMIVDYADPDSGAKDEIQTPRMLPARAQPKTKATAAKPAGKARK